jgi:hypothetical protein
MGRLEFHPDEASAADPFYSGPHGYQPGEEEKAYAAKSGLYWNDARGCYLPREKPCAQVHACPDLDQELPDEFEREALAKIQEEHLMPTEPAPSLGRPYAMPTAVKHDGGKLRYDLLPSDALAELVRVYGIGAAKYGDRNWENGMDWGRVYAAMLRHSQRWWGGERDDPEDGQHHLASVAWCALTLLAYELRGVGTDTRPSLSQRRANPT